MHEWAWIMWSGQVQLKIFCSGWNFSVVCYRNRNTRKIRNFRAVFISIFQSLIANRVLALSFSQFFLNFGSSPSHYNDDFLKTKNIPLQRHLNHNPRQRHQLHYRTAVRDRLACGWDDPSHEHLIFSENRPKLESFPAFCAWQRTACQSYCL